MTFSIRKYLQRYLKSILVWNPVLCIFFVGAYWITEQYTPAHMLRSYSVSLLIADTCTTVGFAGRGLMIFVQQWYFARRGWQMPDQRTWRAWATTGLFMIPGLWVGFRLAHYWAKIIGFPWTQPDLSDWRAGIIFGTICTVIFGLIEFRKEADTARKQAEQKIHDLETANMRAQISALTAQMNPHLLFNALNSIASLTSTEPEAAERMTVALAGLYRRVLAAARKETHALADELELVRAYLDVEQGRFGEKLRFAIEVGAGIDPLTCQVPVLCLQPFVENAVKHGLMSRSAGGQLWVRARQDGRLTLEVEDDGVGFGKSTRTGGSGTALKNCRDRLQLLYGQQGKLEVGQRPPSSSGTLVTLTMPLQTLSEVKA